jgi:hypothetical protein
MQGEMARLCHGIPAGRLLLCADDPLLLAAAGAEAHAHALSRHAVEAIPGGHRLHGGAAAYTLGPDVVGESAWFALQAAAALGERLGIDAAALQDFLRQETGTPAAGLSPHPSRAASG